MNDNRTHDVYVLIDIHTGNVLGTRFFTSEAHAVAHIQDMGFKYDPMLQPIMPATLIYKSDREQK